MGMSRLVTARRDLDGGDEWWRLFRRPSNSVIRNTRKTRHFASSDPTSTVW